MATHSNIHAWKIPWTEEPGRLQSMGLQTKSRTQLNDFTFNFPIPLQPQVTLILLSVVHTLSTIPQFLSNDIFLALELNLGYHSIFICHVSLGASWLWCLDSSFWWPWQFGRVLAFWRMPFYWNLWNTSVIFIIVFCFDLGFFFCHRL